MDLQQEPLAYNPKDIKYGLIAVDPTEEDEMLTILHFCGYWNEPTQADADALRKELAEDPEFGLTDIAHRLIIFPAPDDILQHFISEIEEAGDEAENSL
jgi:hypothetical protein